jgi:hypothetical protein
VFWQSTKASPTTELALCPPNGAQLVIVEKIAVELRTELNLKEPAQAIRPNGVTLLLGSGKSEATVRSDEPANCQDNAGTTERCRDQTLSTRLASTPEVKLFNLVLLVPDQAGPWVTYDSLSTSWSV